MTGARTLPPRLAGQRGALRWLAALLALLTCACATQPLVDPRDPLVRLPVRALAHVRLDPPAVRLTPEPATVEDHWILDLYDGLRGRGYASFRVDFPGADGEAGVAHLLLPEGPGPHPAVLVFPILGGSHVVSEALAKALANRGYAALRVERRRLFPSRHAPESEVDADFARPADRLRNALLDARRLIDWLEVQPDIDAERLAVAGLSIGGIMAATLMGVDDRLQAGVFIIAGGGLPELVHDSQEPPLVRFRERVFAESGSRSREDFVTSLRPYTTPLDPLSYAHRVDPRRVVMVSGRFDRIVPQARTEALWQALGQPRWHRYPGGHYQVAPFFWWSVSRGAALLDEVLGSPQPGPRGPTAAARRLSEGSRRARTARASRALRGRAVPLLRAPAASSEQAVEAPGPPAATSQRPDLQG